MNHASQFQSILEDYNSSGNRDWTISRGVYWKYPTKLLPRNRHNIRGEKAEGAPHLVINKTNLSSPLPLTLHHPRTSTLTTTHIIILKPELPMPPVFSPSVKFSDQDFYTWLINCLSLIKRSHINLDRGPSMVYVEGLDERFHISTNKNDVSGTVCFTVVTERLTAENINIDRKLHRPRDLCTYNAYIVLEYALENLRVTRRLRASLYPSITSF